MRFYIIYDFDTCGQWESVAYYQPRRSILRKLVLTERTDAFGESEYAYLSEDEDPDSWWGGKHRKYCGMLTREEFEDFLDDTGLHFETENTGGSLTEMGFMPAIAFNGYAHNAIQSAYVTPFPDVEDEPTNLVFARNYERICKAMESLYR